MWNYNTYKNWLRARLVEIKNTLDFQDYEIEVFNEQDYAKQRSIKAKTISVVTKFLSSSLVFQAKTQPIQLLVITEENSISVANSILTKFCEDWNFRVVINGKTYTKQMYSTPVVLSNFNLVGIGMRTVLYIGATLFILEDVMDITDVKVILDYSYVKKFSILTTYNKGDLVYYGPATAIYECKNDNVLGAWNSSDWKVISSNYTTDKKAIESMSATIGYTMSGDTQPFDGGYAKTEKNFSTFVLTLNVACVENDFTKFCANIMNGASGGKGNETFKFSFKVGSINFTNFEMKLVGCTITTAVNNVPSLQLSFSV